MAVRLRGNGKYTAKIQSIVAIAFDDAADRDGYSDLAPMDVGIIGRQLDDDSYWLLQSVSPIAWVPLIGLAAGGAPLNVTGSTVLTKDSPTLVVMDLGLGDVEVQLPELSTVPDGRSFIFLTRNMTLPNVPSIAANAVDQSFIPPFPLDAGSKVNLSGFYQQTITFLKTTISGQPFWRSINFSQIYVQGLGSDDGITPDVPTASDGHMQQIGSQAIVISAPGAWTDWSTGAAVSVTGDPYVEDDGAGGFNIKRIGLGRYRVKARAIFTGNATSVASMRIILGVGKNPVPGTESARTIVVGENLIESEAFVYLNGAISSPVRVQFSTADGTDLTTEECNLWIERSGN